MKNANKLFVTIWVLGSHFTLDPLILTPFQPSSGEVCDGFDDGSATLCLVRTGVWLRAHHLGNAGHREI